MATSITGEVMLPADRATVWAALNDPDILKACIPGCHRLEQTGATAYLALARMKVGPLSASIKGNINLSNIDPPNGYRISGEGQGGLAGFANGTADVTLIEAAGGCTVLRYDVQASLGGRIARMGGRLIDGVAKTTADKFFSRFAAALVR